MNKIGIFNQTEEEVKELNIRVKESSSPDRSSYIRTRIFSENSSTLSALDRAEALHALNNIKNRYPNDKISNWNDN